MLALAITSTALIACDKDDENTGNSHPAEYVGQWSMIESIQSDNSFPSPSTTTYPEGKMILILNSDGTGCEAEPNWDNSGYDVWDGYKWYAQDSKLSIDYGDGDGYVTYQVNEISDTRMVLEFTDTEGRFDGEHTIETYVKTNFDITTD